MDYNQVKAKNIEYFSGLLAEGIDEHHAVAQSKVSHHKRFAKMMELGDFNGKRPLDIGCGMAGFYGYLKEWGVDAVYTGVDINPRMIDAARETYPHLSERLFVHDIIEQPLGESFDYIVSVGPLNLKFEDDLNERLTEKLIRAMYQTAEVGTAISMTSSLTQKPHPGTFYYDPAAVMRDAMTFCANVRLDHTFLPHDFVLFCYKKDLYDF